MSSQPQNLILILPSHKGLEAESNWVTGNVPYSPAAL